MAPHLTFVQIHVSVTHTQRRTVALLAKHLAYTLCISLWHLHWLFWVSPPALASFSVCSYSSESYPFCT